MSRSLFHDKNLSSEAAIYSPQGLLKQRFFWESQTRFLVLCVLGILFILALVPVTYPIGVETMASYLLTFFIQLFVVWGLYLGACIIAEIGVEQAIVDYIELRGTSHLRKIQANQAHMVDLEKLELDFLPNNPSTPTPAMIRLFQHICKEAKDRKFESSIHVIQPYKDESVGRIFEVQNIQTIALRLGILGTFVGLILAIERLLTLKDALSISRTANEGFFSVISGLFNDLYISFSTSIAGLEVAIVLAFLLSVVRQKQDTYFRSMENAVVTMLSLARHSINKYDFQVEFGQINNSIKQLDNKYYQQTQKITDHILAVEQSISRQTTEIQTGIDELANAKVKFEGFLADIDEIQRKFVADMKDIYDVLSMKRLTAEIQAGIAKTGEEIAEKLNPNVLKISDKLTEFTASTNQLTQTYETHAREVSENMAKMEGQIKEQIENINNGVQAVSQTELEFGKFLKEMIASMEKFITEVKEAQAAISIKELGKGLHDSVVYAGNEISKSLIANLQEISDKIAAINKSLLLVDLSAIPTALKKLRGKLSKTDGHEVQVVDSEHFEIKSRRPEKTDA